jgi:hypothetical protein
MIGEHIAYQVPDTTGKLIDQTGWIVDKVQTTDRIFDEENKLLFVSPHDIYLVKNDVGEVSAINPMRVIKIIKK